MVLFLTIKPELDKDDDVLHNRPQRPNKPRYGLDEVLLFLGIRQQTQTISGVARQGQEEEEQSKACWVKPLA
jgi:hypothetical protein